MGYLVDSSIWIEVERGRLSAGDIAKITGESEIYLSPINIAELQLGADLIKDENLKLRANATIARLRRKPLLRIDFITGEIFGKVSANLRKNGRGESFRIMDVWLAAQCIQHNHILLTKNSKDFLDIDGLKIIEIK